MKQLIYKQVCDVPFAMDVREDLQFVFAISPLGLLRIFPFVLQHWGAKETAKVLVKLITSKRLFYAVLKDGRMVHFGWVSVGFDSHYPVADEDCVIGPIWSARAVRGQGVATWALKRAINRLQKLAFDTFWIDTSDDNVSCLRVIEHCGFGEHIGDYER